MMDREELLLDNLPICLRQSPPQCREIQINAKVPLDWALPLYGFLMPLVVAVTVLTNSFIVVVLSQRSLRTPTNFVLGAMAISELLTGLVCLPWLLYYYTFRGYLRDQREGLPPFWCVSFPYMATSLPSIFHTAAIWLTVYLAVQRYIYICLPKLVRTQCTIGRSKQVTVTVFVLSVWIYAPELFASYNQSAAFVDPRTNSTRSMCLMSRTALIQMVGNNLYYFLLYGLHTVLVHTLPCILLVVFTWKLVAAIRRADKKHCSLVGRSKQAHRKMTSAGGVVLPAMEENAASSTPILGGQSSLEDGVHWPSAAELPSGTTASTGAKAERQQPPPPRASLCESRRVQGLKQNTRMLLAVILLFLVTEIPAALIFSIHVGTVSLKLPMQQQHYAILNRLLIVRNVLIVISYPFRFAIYCGMSAQFREVVQQMLTRRKWFLAAITLRFPYGKLQQQSSSTTNRTARNGTTEASSESISPADTKRTSVVFQKASALVWRNNRRAVENNSENTRRTNAKAVAEDPSRTGKTEEPKNKQMEEEERKIVQQREEDDCREEQPTEAEGEYECRL